MEKRKVIFGKYDTDFHGLWTLNALELTDPEYQAHFQEVPGRDGPLDLSTVLTDGEPRYGPRTLTATLESSEGTRQDRQVRISEMVNTLDGRRMNIIHPDYPGHYLTGRIQVKVVHSGLVNASVMVTANCDPWLYALNEKRFRIQATESKQMLSLANRGRRIAVPYVTVTGGTTATVLLEFGTMSMDLGPGSYTLPDLQLHPGNTVVTYSGTAAAEITYREAVLR